MECQLHQEKRGGEGGGGGEGGVMKWFGLWDGFRAGEMEPQDARLGASAEDRIATIQRGRDGAGVGYGGIGGGS